MSNFLCILSRNIESIDSAIYLAFLNSSKLHFPTSSIPRNIKFNITTIVNIILKMFIYDESRKKILLNFGEMKEYFSMP